MTMAEQIKSKLELRQRLLNLLNKDKDWYKKDNELTRQIQQVAKEMERKEYELQLIGRLSVDEFLWLISEDYLDLEIAWRKNLKKGQMTEWRRINGFGSKSREEILDEYHDKILELRRIHNDNEAS